MKLKQIKTFDVKCGQINFCRKLTRHKRIYVNPSYEHTSYESGRYFWSKPVIEEFIKRENVIQSYLDMSGSFAIIDVQIEKWGKNNKFGVPDWYPNHRVSFLPLLDKRSYDNFSMTDLKIEVRDQYDMWHTDPMDITLQEQFILAYVFLCKPGDTLEVKELDKIEEAMSRHGTFCKSTPDQLAR